MKILFLGDSITAGAGLDSQDKNYVTLVGMSFGATVVNYGVGGTRIARKKQPSADPAFDEDFLKRAEKMDKTADLVFVFGGTNDYGHGDAPIGNPDDETPYTFCGALNVLVKMLGKTYGSDKVCFILPIHRKDEDNPFGEDGQKTVKSGTLIDFVNAEKVVLERNKVKYLDLNDVFPREKLGSLTIDGIHPNQLGHALIADKLVAYIGSQRTMNKLLR